MRTARTIITIAALFACATFALANERQHAVTALNEYFRCAPPNENKVSNNIRYIYKADNRPHSTVQALAFQEHYTEAEMSTGGGEGYVSEGYIEVKASFRDIGEVAVNKTKVTVRCRGGSQCLTVNYHTDGDGYHTEKGVRRTRKSSFRISACRADVARDMREAILFLAE